MAVATSAQSWYTSKTVWTGITAVISNGLILAGAFGVILTPQQTVGIMGVWNSILAIAAVAFRWSADQSLTLSPGAPALPPAPPAVVAAETAADIAAAGAGK